MEEIQIQTQTPSQIPNNHLDHQLPVQAPVNDKPQLLDSIIFSVAVEIFVIMEASQNCHLSELMVT